MIIEQIQNISKGAQNEFSKQIGVQVSISGNLVVVIPRVKLPGCARGVQQDRKPIKEFTQSAATRMRRYLRESVPEYNTLITLTYPEGHGYSGGRAKRDLKVFMQRLKREFVYDIYFSAFWFMEFQSRGAIHFHIFTNRPYPKGRLARDWYDICSTEDVRHLRAGTRIEAIRSGRHGISAYAAKYAAKHCQKVVPEHFGWTGRFWGVVGDRRTVSAATFVTPYDLVSSAVQRRVNSIETMLEDAVFDQRARFVNVKHAGCKVIFIKDKLLIPSLRVMIDMVNVTASYKRTEESILFDLESRYDITDDTEGWVRGMPKKAEPFIPPVLYGM